MVGATALFPLAYSRHERFDSPLGTQYASQRSFSLTRRGHTGEDDALAAHTRPGEAQSGQPAKGRGPAKQTQISRCFAGAVEPESPPLVCTLYAVNLGISGSAGHGLWRGDEPEPCARWQWPCACGTRAPWNADASWADKVRTILITSCIDFQRETPPTTTAALPQPRLSNPWQPKPQKVMIT